MAFQLFNFSTGSAFHAYTVKHVQKGPPLLFLIWPSPTTYLPISEAGASRATIRALLPSHLSQIPLLE